MIAGGHRETNPVAERWKMLAVFHEFKTITSTIDDEADQSERVKSSKDANAYLIQYN